MSENVPLTKADLQTAFDTLTEHLGAVLARQGEEIQVAFKEQRAVMQAALEEQRAVMQAALEEQRAVMQAALEEQRAVMQAALAEQREETRAALQEQREYIDERSRDMQTELLRAFGDYSALANVRFRKLEADTSNIDTSATQRLGELERQMTEFKLRLIALEGRS